MPSIESKSAKKSDSTAISTPDKSSPKGSIARPKVLRIGVLQSGKIIEERIIRKRVSVTVGQSEKNNFIIFSNELPSRFEMFELKDGAYSLLFTESMQGRFSLQGKIKELSELKKTGECKRRGKFYEIGLEVGLCFLVC